MRKSLREQEIEAKEQELEAMYEEFLPQDKVEVDAEPVSEAKPAEEAEPTETPSEVIKLEPEIAVSETEPTIQTTEPQAVSPAAPVAADDPFSALQQQYNDLRGWTTRASQKNADVERENNSLKKTLEELNAKFAATPKAPSSTFLSIKEEYGDELAGKFQQLIREEVDASVVPISNEINSIRAEDAVASTEALRLSLPPNAKQIVNSSDFQLWMSKPTMLSIGQKQSAFTSENVEDSKHLLKQYAHERNIMEKRRGQKADEVSQNKPNLKEVANATAEPKSAGTSAFGLAVNQKPKYTVEQVAAMPAAEFKANRDEIYATLLGAAI